MTFYEDSGAVIRARNFIAGEDLGIDEIRALLKELKCQTEFSVARRLLLKALENKPVELAHDNKLFWHQQLALCTSKDPALGLRLRTDKALRILERCDLSAVRRKRNLNPEDQETLGITGGIFKQKWRQYAQIEDLKESLKCYTQGAKGGIKGDYGYNAINAAYINDVFASIESSEKHYEEAERIRHEIVTELNAGEELNEWWFYATLVEAYVGLGNYTEAQIPLSKALAIKDVPFWEYEATTRQLVEIYQLQRDKNEAQSDPEFRKIISDLLFTIPATSGEDENKTDRITHVENKEDVIDNIFVGNVGLALSGGGFRASFFHLGVLAKLAELDLLRHISAISTVSGGSIVGAAYYLKIKKLYDDRRKSKQPIEHKDYVNLVQELIEEFKQSVRKDMRGSLFVPIRNAFTAETGVGLKLGYKLYKVYRCFRKGKLSLLRKHLPETSKAYEGLGVLDTEEGAEFLQRHFYQEILGADGDSTIMMHDLQVEPFDHNPRLGVFNPTIHNWRRDHKIPALTINATTSNTGHGWQFTATWMGETPYEEMDYNSIPRLRRCRYSNERGVPLAKAVAASAAVPGVFRPVVLENYYEADHGENNHFDVRLVDGGIFDNQGTFSLIEQKQNCSVLIVSDAAGQMAMEYKKPDGIFGPVNALKRTMELFMERIRQANLSELLDRVDDNRLRSVMIVYAQDDLHSAPLDWRHCEDPTSPKSPSSITACGINRDIQQALCEIRTDLDVFHEDESDALIAFGYKLASYSHAKTIRKDLKQLNESPLQPDAGWSFAPMVERICSQKTDDVLLHNLREGKKAIGDRNYIDAPPD